MMKSITKFFTKKLEQKSGSDYFLSDFSHQRKITPAEYANNVIVFRCVNIISQTSSHIPWVILKKSAGKCERLEDHPLYSILKKPNNMESGADFFTELVATKLLYGNAYVLAQGSHEIDSMVLLHPNDVELSYVNGIAKSYKYKSNNKTYEFPINPKTQKCQILHIRNYTPLPTKYGVSCLKPASKSIELHNATSDWNNSLLKNGARPTGALIMKDSTQFLSDEQFERLQKQLYEKFSGINNSGKPLLLEGGLDWRDMSVNPKDMDYIESKNASAREIALAFGLPPQLLGLNGDNTYSNMQEARIALWEETIIPLLDQLSDSFSNWFSSWTGEEIIVDFDRNSISSLSEKRQNALEKIAKADFMTINEKRALVGLAAIDGGDVLDGTK